MFRHCAARNIYARSNYIVSFNRFETSTVFLQEPIVRTCDHGAAIRDSLIGTTNFNNSLGMRIRERPQQNAVNDREYGRVRADTEGQREDGYRAEDWIFARHA